MKLNHKEHRQRAVKLIQFLIQIIDFFFQGVKILFSVFCKVKLLIIVRTYINKVIKVINTMMIDKVTFSSIK